MIDIIAIIKKNKKIAFGTALFFLVLTVPVFLHDVHLGLALCIGLAFILLLSVLTVATLFKLGVKDEKLFKLFVIVFLIHLCVSLLLYYILYHTTFRPLGGGGDYDLYQNNAIEIANRFKAGNFSLQGMFAEHYFSVFIGVIYIFTLPHTLVGQLFTVWVAAVSILLVYLLVLEIGGSKRWAFLIGIIASIYPSYLYFGSVLLKEILVIPLVIGGALLAVQIFKKFSPLKFLAFFATVSAVIHFRFYIGLALLFSFILCWFIISSLAWRDRIVYGLAMTFILGFSPYLMGYGYMGETPINIYITKKEITNLREVVYSPDSEIETVAPEVNTKGQEARTWDLAERIKRARAEGKNLEGRVLTPEELIRGSGVGSSFTVSTGFDSPFTFVLNYFLSFVYTIFGPFLWQIKFKRQLISLIEMIPWYLFFSVIAYNMYVSIKNNGFVGFLHKYKYAFFLVTFSLFAGGALSLFINNFGIITRIRMPMIISLLCLMSLEPNVLNMLDNIVPKFLKNKIH